MNNWTKMMLTAGLVAVPTWAMAQAPAAPAAPAAPGQGQGQAAAAADNKAGDVPGPIDSLSDIQDSGKMLFKMADTNNDGQISQKEATDAGNLMVGGFFFRADADGDGTLTHEEAQQAQQALFAQQPLLRLVAERSKRGGGNQGGGNNAGGNGATNDPAKAVGNFLDTNNDKKLQASEVRDAVKTGVQGMFAVADTNRDNQMSPTEFNAAVIGAARAAAQAAFDQADDDKNGQISRGEFDKAIVEPAGMVFRLLDANGDGQLSSQEAQRAQQLIGNQLKMLSVPEPANSASNLIRTGNSPEQVAPVPGTPRR